MYEKKTKRMKKFVEFTNFVYVLNEDEQTKIILKKKKNSSKI